MIGLRYKFNLSIVHRMACRQDDSYEKTSLKSCEIITTVIT
jgi:hypothetical protein